VTLLVLLLLLVCTPASVDRIVSLGIRTASIMCTRPTLEASLSFTSSASGKMTVAPSLLRPEMVGLPDLFRVTALHRQSGVVEGDLNAWRQGCSKSKHGNHDSPSIEGTNVFCSANTREDVAWNVKVRHDM